MYILFKIEVLIHLLKNRILGAAVVAMETLVYKMVFHGNCLILGPDVG